MEKVFRHTASCVDLWPFHCTCSVLAVGGSDGSVCLYSVEDGNALHRFSAGAPITHLSWKQLDNKEWVVFGMDHFIYLLSQL